MMARARNVLLRWYSIPLLLLVWYVSVETGFAQSRLLPSPVRVWGALVADFSDGTLPYHAYVTISRAMIGFFLATAVGVPFAALIARSVTWRNLFEPIFFVGYPVPKIALFPVFVYAFGIGATSKIAFTFLECLYPIVVSCYFGFRAIQTRLIWTAQNFGANRRTVLRRVVLPAALPSVFAGLRVALPVSIIVVVITEMIGNSIGLGYYIEVNGTSFDFARVYAGIVTVGVCGFLLDRVMMFARARIVYWQKGESQVQA